MFRYPIIPHLIMSYPRVTHVVLINPIILNCEHVGCIGWLADFAGLGHCTVGFFHMETKLSGRLWALPQLV